MCLPALGALGAMSSGAMMAASLAVSTISAVAGFAAESQNAKLQYEQKVAHAERTRTEAVRNLNEQSIDLHQRELEERAATAYRVNEQRQNAEQAAATARASSESSGLSIEALLADFEGQYGSYADAQMMQLGFTTDQLQRNRESLHAQATSRINNVDLNPVVGPSPLGLVADIGGSYLGAYDKYSVVDPITGTRTVG